MSEWVVGSPGKSSRVHSALLSPHLAMMIDVGTSVKFSIDSSVCVSLVVVAVLASHPPKLVVREILLPKHVMLTQCIHRPSSTAVRCSVILRSVVTFNSSHNIVTILPSEVLGEQVGKVGRPTYALDRVQLFSSNLFLVWDVGTMSESSTFIDDGCVLSHIDLGLHPCFVL